MAAFFTSISTGVQTTAASAALKSVTVLTNRTTILDEKEEKTTRYMLAMLLAVGIGIATVVPPTLAQTVNKYGNRVVLKET